MVILWSCNWHSPCTHSISRVGAWAMGFFIVRLHVMQCNARSFYGNYLRQTHALRETEINICPDSYTIWKGDASSQWRWVLSAEVARAACWASLRDGWVDHFSYRTRNRGRWCLPHPCAIRAEDFYPRLHCDGWLPRSVSASTPRSGGETRKAGGTERRRREDRGAEGGRVWGGGVPLPTGGGVWGGGSPENF